MTLGIREGVCPALSQGFFNTCLSFQGMNSAMLGPLMPNLEVLLHTDATGMGIILACRAAGTTVGAVFCGLFFHRY